MSALTKAEPQELAAPNDTAAIISVIEAAARNPDVDVDKLDRLLAMQERIMDRQADQAFSAAMNAAQAELRPVATDAANPQTRSRYASYPALDNACRPIYSRHGFSLSFNTADGAPVDHLRLACKVRHSGGHTEAYQVDMPSDGKGAKGGDVMTKTHATGAAMSYGQRYLLKLIFNIAVGEDRDGNSPELSKPISETQAADLQALMEEVGADRPKFLAYLKVGSISEIPFSQYDRAIAALEAKRNAK